MDHRQRASNLIHYLKEDQTWDELAAKVGCSPVWLCSAFLGDSSMSDDIWCKLVALAEEKSQKESDPERKSEHSDVAVDAKLRSSACKPQPKAKTDWDTLKQDPTLYRMHEINLVYGRAIREVIHEKFGDGIMSAVDLKIGVEKISDPSGDRVKLTLNGKFLPYKPW